MPDDGTPEPSRKEQILQALATMLEQSPGGRITTARLAAQVGGSEAALYRHFPSKARMFEGLIEFIEETVFTRITRILREEPAVDLRCEATLRLLLTFAERNPGISRILTGDPLVGETERLRVRIAQFFERLDPQLQQLLREKAACRVQISRVCGPDIRIIAIPDGPFPDDSAKIFIWK